MKHVLCTLGLAVLLFAVGCGDSAPPEDQPPVDADVEEFVTSHFGDELFTTLMRLRGEDGPLRQMLANQPPSFPPGGPPPGFGRGGPPMGPGPQRPGFAVDPADRYVDSLYKDQPFARLTSQPNLNANLYDGDLKARITSVRVTGHEVVNQKTRLYQVEVTQQLDVDLLRLRNAVDLKKAIGWDDAVLQPARREAAKLPPTAQAELQQQWTAAEKSRRHVMERMHTAGSIWTSSGEVRARLEAGNWRFEFANFKAEEKPSVSLVTPEFIPEGLMIVDPSDYQASAEEWKQPYEEFIARVTLLSDEHAGLVEQRRRKLSELFVAGTRWRTTVSGSSLSTEITLTIERVTEEGRIYGVFIARRNGQETVVPVYGRPFDLADYDVADRKLKASADLLGPTLRMEVDSPDEWSPPWSELEFFIALAAVDDQPTLLWENVAAELRPEE